MKDYFLLSSTEFYTIDLWLKRALELLEVHLLGDVVVTPSM